MQRGQSEKKQGNGVTSQSLLYTYSTTWALRSSVSHHARSRNQLNAGRGPVDGSLRARYRVRPYRTAPHKSQPGRDRRYRRIASVREHNNYGWKNRQNTRSRQLPSVCYTLITLDVRARPIPWIAGDTISAANACPKRRWLSGASRVKTSPSSWKTERLRPFRSRVDDLDLWVRVTALKLSRCST